MTLLLLALLGCPPSGDRPDDSARETGDTGRVPSRPLTGTRSLAEAEIALLGEAVADRAAFAVAAGSDLDGDGRSELVVGQSDADARAGRVQVLDDPGDGTFALADLGFTVTGADASETGYAVALPGDLDGDGHDDLVVGAPGADVAGERLGAAWVFRGPITGDLRPEDAHTRLVGLYPGSRFAGRLRRAGDLDGDGALDLVVTAWLEDRAGDNSGTTYVFTSFPEGTVGAEDATATLVGTAAGDWSGWAAEGAGDVDGDGIDDLVVGGDGYDAGAEDTGAVWLLFGPVVGEWGLDAAPVRLTGREALDLVGHAAGTAGDVDGDGRAEIVVGAFGQGEDFTGAAYVLHDPASGYLDAHDVALLGEEPKDFVGYSVRAAGDVDGDGFDDVLVGARYGGGGAGSVALLYGPETATAEAVFVGVADGDEASWAMAAGDIDGDGRPDLAIVAPEHGEGGAVYVVRAGTDE